MRKLFSDIGYTGASHVFSSLLLLGVQIFIVRATSPQAFGEYTSASATVSLAQILLLARGGEVALQHIGRHWSLGDYAAAHSVARQLKRLDWTLNWAFYALLALLTLLLFRALKLNALYVLGLALAIPAQIGFGVYKSMFIATHRLKHQALFEIAYSLVYGASCVLGVYLYGIPGLIGAVVLASLIKNLLARHITEKWWLEDARSAPNDSVKIGFWKGVGVQPTIRNAFINGANQIDILILNAAIGAQHAAIYKVAKSMATLPARIAGPVWSALMPRILKAWHVRDRAKLKMLIIIPSLIMISALAVAFVPLWRFADDFMVMLYGKEYVSAAPPFLILIVGAWFFSGCVSPWFNFLVIIDERKLTGTLVYGFWFSAVLVGGYLLGGRSATHMAAVVSGVMVGISLICWSTFIKRVGNSGENQRRW